jgi:hypothetical protein
MVMGSVSDKDETSSRFTYMTKRGKADQASFIETGDEEFSQRNSNRHSNRLAILQRHELQSTRDEGFAILSTSQRGESYSPVIPLKRTKTNQFLNPNNSSTHHQPQHTESI